MGEEAEEAEYARCTIIFVICAGRPRDLDGEVRDVGRRREEADDVVEQLGKHVAERRECQRGRVSDVAAERALDRKSTRLNSSHSGESRMPSSA